MNELHWMDFDAPLFPPTESALEQPAGLLAAGGNLEPGTLMAAYYRGIFPWYSENEPPLWWAPNPRAVLEPGDLLINRTTAKLRRRQPFRFTSDVAFDAVVQYCADVREDETWIVDEMILAYRQLHRCGHAHSLEVWQDNELVGGLYGVQVGAVFCGESMFHLAPNASKLAFICLAETLFARGYAMIDCQLQNPFLASLGVKEIPRTAFESRLRRARDRQIDWPGSWRG